MGLSTLARKRLWRAGIATVFAAVLLILYDLAWQPLMGGELVTRSGPTDPAAVPVTGLPHGEEFANHQASKGGQVPLVVPLALAPADGPVSVVTRDWSARFDTRFGPQLMELTAQRLTYAAGQKEPLMRNKHGGRASVSLPLVGNYVQQGLWEIQPGKKYYLLLPLASRQRSDDYAVWVRKRAPEVAGRLLPLGAAMFVGGMALVFLFGTRLSRSPDPVEAARAYVRYGRVAEARLLLRRAHDAFPHRRAEIEAELARIDLAARTVR